MSSRTAPCSTACSLTDPEPRYHPYLAGRVPFGVTSRRLRRVTAARRIGLGLHGSRLGRNAAPAVPCPPLPPRRPDATFRLSRPMPTGSRLLTAVLLAAAGVWLATASAFGAEGVRELPRNSSSFVEANCLDCHSGGVSESNFDLAAVGFDLSHREVFDRWVLIHARTQNGEMPPPESGVPRPVAPMAGARARTKRAAVRP